MGTGKRVAVFIAVLLVIDQVVKIWIKTHMMLGEEIPVLGDWFKILFVENNGMAFGMQLSDGRLGKSVLSLFRIGAVVAICWYILKLLKGKTPKGVVYSFALILCGAVGNIFDSLFYGMAFGDSHGQVAAFLPEGGGYAGFLHGKVVDMLYFPLVEGSFPAWFPVWGGEDFIFFRPVFNLADSYITIGVCILLLFYRSFFSEKKEAGPKKGRGSKA